MLPACGTDQVTVGTLHTTAVKKIDTGILYQAYYGEVGGDLHTNSHLSWVKVA